MHLFPRGGFFFSFIILDFVFYLDVFRQYGHLRKYKPKSKNQVSENFEFYPEIFAESKRYD